MPKLALVGDYNPKVPAHRVIPTALGLVCVATGVKLEWAWIGTEKITDESRDHAGFACAWLKDFGGSAAQDLACWLLKISNAARNGSSRFMPAAP